VHHIWLKQLNGNNKGWDWYDWVVEAYTLKSTQDRTISNIGNNIFAMFDY
jgi:hypothetical protein